MSGLERLGTPLPHRVAVLRALHLGDLLCAIPSLRALRTALPGAEITLIGLPWARELVARLPHYLDNFLSFPGYPGLPERPPCLPDIPGFLAVAQARQFDLALQMHGNGSITNPLAVLLGARHTAGFYAPPGYCPDPDRFLPYPEGEPEVRRHLRLMEFLGVPSRGERLEFPVGDSDWDALAEVAEIGCLRPGAYVCLHPGARESVRRWSPVAFAAVADALAARGLSVVLTGGESEAALTRAVAAHMRAPALDLAGRTSLGALAALLMGARLLVCNDTGVSHLAAALGTPSVVVFLASDPRRWAPLDRERHYAVCVRGQGDASAVLATAEQLLRKEAGRVAV